MLETIKTLVVDDDERFASNMVKLLRTQDIDASVAPNGAVALEILAREAIDVVLLDMKMPAPSGVETMRRIRDLGTTAQVIFLTGHASVDEALAGLNLGAFDYVLKPASTEMIVGKIKLAYAKKQKLSRKETEKGDPA